MLAFTPIQTEDEPTTRNFNALQAILSDFAASPFGQFMVGSRTSTPVDSYAIGEESVVVYRGATGKTLTVPGAAYLGPGISRWLLVINDSSVSVALGLATGDALSGSATVASAGFALLVSDGAMKWFRVI